ncbi:CapA family protein [Providencia sp. PROV174]|uniref:CapA family protein n=1 Tax=Providencia sp. PROV174 TaxID=2949877 RepID=UPI00234B023F|nr:CapA family protein [Providencia sp. PROV174]
MKNQKLKILGDVFLDKPYKSFDIDNYIFNLEYPITNNMETPALNKVNLFSNDLFAKETFGKNPIGVTLANNHIFDFGLIGAKDTIRTLENNNIKYCGIGNIENNFNNPMIINTSEQHYFILNYCCESTHPSVGDNELNIAILEIEKVKSDILSIMKTKNTFIIVIIHWGDEEISYPNPNNIKIAHTLIDYGADLIVGHHAHVTQSYDIYKGCMIYYGIGNAIFPDLDVPSFYENNISKQNFIKKQSNKNKQGYMIEVNRAKAHCIPTYFDNDSYYIDSKKIKNKINWPKIIGFENYRKLIRRSIMLKNFISSPRIPNINRIKRFIIGSDE